MKSQIIFIFIFDLFLLSGCKSTNTTQVQPGSDPNHLRFSNQLSASADKMAAEKAKKLRKAGYYEEPSAPPIEMQLLNSFMYESAMDGNGNPKYLIASGNVLARTTGNATQAATELAKLKIAGYIQSHIMGIVKTDLSNKQLSMKEAESINKSISVYTNMIAQNLNIGRPVAILLRNVGGDRVEADVRIAYNPGDNIQAVREVIVNKLEEDTNLTRKQLDELFKIDKFKNITPDSNSPSNAIQ